MEHPDIQQLDFGFGLEPKKPSPKPTNQSFKKASSDAVFDIMDVLTSPIMVYPSAWQDMVPKHLLDNIATARMMTWVRKEHMASLTEVVAYMMPRTFEAPLPSEWVNIYTWCGLQFAKTLEKTGRILAMEEIAPQQLSKYEKVLLQKLRVWIYEKRRQALRDKLKTTKRSETKPTKNNQSSLF